MGRREVAAISMEDAGDPGSPVCQVQDAPCRCETSGLAA